MRREYFEKENNVMGFNNGNAVFDYWFNSVYSKTQNIRRRLLAIYCHRQEYPFPSKFRRL